MDFEQGRHKALEKDRDALGVKSMGNMWHEGI